MLTLSICVERGAIRSAESRALWCRDGAFRGASQNRIGRIDALVGEPYEFLRLVLVPHLFGDVPIKACMRAKPLGEVSRIGHGGRSGRSGATMHACGVL